MSQDLDDEEEEQIVDKERDLRKFWTVLLLVNLAFIIIIIRLFVIQVYDSERFHTRAVHQHQSKLTLRAERGNIFDREGRLIASTIHSLSIAVDPKVLTGKNQICKALEIATGIPQNVFLKKINSAKGSFVWLARGIMPNRAIGLDTLKYPGLLKFKEPKRNFLYGQVGSQVIGTANIDNRGISGIEKAYDSLLIGTSGYMIMQRDARGRLHATADLPIIQPVNGKSIQLTIDIELQRIVEYELMQGVLKMEAASGTIIAIKPETGEILAMASYPTFDPNSISSMNIAGMKNKAITDVYEPGSTFKLITATAAIEEGIMTPQTIVNGYGGRLDFGKYVIRDDHPVGIVSFEKAFEQSSNVVFAQVGDSIPVNKFYKYIRDFGFGNTLGIDIIGEVKGRIPRPNRFFPSTKRYISHGYGVSVTALQLTSAYSTIANDGVLMRPFVVKSVINSQGEIIHETKPQKIRRVVSDQTCKTLKKMLVAVVDSGTGKNARINGIEIAGKTGTSQQLDNGSYSKRHYTGSFAGFFPAYDPQIAMVVIIDKPKGIYYGGLTAAPVFYNVASRWIAINSEYANDKISSDNDTVSVPSLKGFFSADAMDILRDYNLKPVLNNLKDGIIMRQEPEAGSMVSKRSNVILYAERFETLITDLLDKKTIRKNYRPDVRGLILKKAINVLHNAGVKVNITGKGSVKSQYWFINSKGENCCTLNCSH